MRGRRGSGESVGEGDGDGGGATLDSQLGVDAGEVAIDRARGDEKAVGSLGVGQTLDDQSQHLGLTLGQAEGEGRANGSKGWRSDSGAWLRIGRHGEREV